MGFGGVFCSQVWSGAEETGMDMMKATALLEHVMDADFEALLDEAGLRDQPDMVTELAHDLFMRVLEEEVLVHEVTWTEAMVVFARVHETDSSTGEQAHALSMRMWFTDGLETWFKTPGDSAMSLLMDFIGVDACATDQGQDWNLLGAHFVPVPDGVGGEYLDMVMQRWHDATPDTTVARIDFANRVFSDGLPLL